MVGDTSRRHGETVFDAVVVGAGFAGMYMLHRLRGLGLFGAGVRGRRRRRRHLVLESLSRRALRRREHAVLLLLFGRAGPGVELVGEILAATRNSRYANHVADRFDLRRHIVFDTRVTAATFDEVEKCWSIETDRGDKVFAQFLIMAVGCLSAPNRPDFEGIEDFRGPIYHTGEWPHEGVDFTGLRVGVIGTGSSAIQSIPIIAQQAAALTVFQRTATWSVPAFNEKLTPEYLRAAKANYPALRAKARGRPTGILFSVQHEAGAGGEPRRARTAIRGSLGARRPALPRLLWRPAVREGRQRHHRRLRPPQDPRHCEGPGHGRTALSRRTSSAASGSASIPIISRPTICRTSNWSMFPRRRSSASPSTASRSAVWSIRWMPWSAPPALPP